MTPPKKKVTFFTSFDDNPLLIVDELITDQHINWYDQDQKNRLFYGILKQWGNKMILIEKSKQENIGLTHIFHDILL